MARLVGLLYWWLGQYVSSWFSPPMVKNVVLARISNDFAWPTSHDFSPKRLKKTRQIVAVKRIGINGRESHQHLGGLWSLPFSTLKHSICMNLTPQTVAVNTDKSRQILSNLILVDDVELLTMRRGTQIYIPTTWMSPFFDECNELQFLPGDDFMPMDLNAPLEDEEVNLQDLGRWHLPVAKDRPKGIHRTATHYQFCWSCSTCLFSN